MTKATKQNQLPGMDTFRQKDLNAAAATQASAHRQAERYRARLQAAQ